MISVDYFPKKYTVRPILDRNVDDFIPYLSLLIQKRQRQLFLYVRWFSVWSAFDTIISNLELIDANRRPQWILADTAVNPISFILLETSKYID